MKEREGGGTRDGAGHGNGRSFELRAAKGTGHMVEEQETFFSLSLGRALPVTVRSRHFNIFLLDQHLPVVTT